MVPGSAAADAPLPGGGWLLRRLAGHGFTALVFDGDATALGLDAIGAVPVAVISLPADGEVARRYDAQAGTVYLLRPDQHVCARWRNPRATDIAAALNRALGRT